MLAEAETNARILPRLPSAEMITSLAPFLRRLSDWRRRRRRARKRLHMLREADLVILSLGKSGRTWLRAMISNLYHQRYGVPEDRLIRFDDFHQHNPAIPRILFTHDLPGDPWNQRRRWRQHERADKEPFHGKRVLLLARDPRDVAVSMYFHYAKRSTPKTRARLGLPEDMIRDLPVADFMLGSRGGRLAHYVDVLNTWAARLRALPGSLMVRYEDLRADPERELQRIADEFLDGGFTTEHIQRAVAFASLESLREKERQGFFASARLRAGDPSDADSYKVRQGKVGGWRVYLTAEQAVRAEAILARFDPAFSYGRSNQAGNLA
jgi:Sulfotransferase domain